MFQRSSHVGGLLGPTWFDAFDCLVHKINKAHDERLPLSSPSGAGISGYHDNRKTRLAYHQTESN
jgi:hypothetical protein